MPVDAARRSSDGRGREHGRSAPSSPEALIGRDAPPFLVVNGSVDTLVVPADVRAFADAIAAASSSAVVHAEIPGMHHNFDFFHSLRFHRICDAVEHFATLALTREPDALRKDHRTRGAARS
jgi:acetyl esterase/lipase